ncbi:uncharacterized protein N7506_010078 [Penicillium brevicompactum]|uniref:uncharacterized protein n=1 Tax=Penicillium brevicompactum TaxID=5074 RepID=UPI00254125BE|nr:uncharacterized protein N7506_010078 [Penicillium brevicompactum]KAJ5326976.1 hypothetical protein N7506_010078 [Penicillium brevicompactum]
MNCHFQGVAHHCSLRVLAASMNLWYVQYVYPDFRQQQFPVLVGKPVGNLLNDRATISMEQKAGPSPSSVQRLKRGPSYSELWYKTPLDNAALARKPNEMRIVLEELRMVQARIEYDIQKLLLFVGDDVLDEKTPGQGNAFHEAGSDQNEAGSDDDFATPSDGTSVGISTLAINSPVWESNGHEFEGDDIEGQDADEEYSVANDTDAVSDI